LPSYTSSSSSPSTLIYLSHTEGKDDDKAKNGYWDEDPMASGVTGVDDDGGDEAVVGAELCRAAALVEPVLVLSVLF
jgi:hypothetical protein